MALKNSKTIIGGLTLMMIIGTLNYKVSVLNDEKKEIENNIVKVEKKLYTLKEESEEKDKLIEEKDKLIQEKTEKIEEKEKEIDKINKQLKELNKKYEEVKKESNKTGNTAKARTTASSYNVTTKEIDLLERLVYCEAGAESEKGQIAIVNVIFNRLNDNEFPDTITEIIYQKNQFSPVSNGKIDRVKADKQVKTSVQKALRGEKVISDESVYFFATWVRGDHPIRNHVKILQTIGVHHFGKWM